VPWKNTTQVFHTMGAPPSDGSSDFATIGSSENNRKEPRASAIVKMDVVNGARSSG
jgi:hypothetical protein